MKTTRHVYDEALNELRRGSVDCQFTLEAVHEILLNPADDVNLVQTVRLAEKLITAHFDALDEM